MPPKAKVNKEQILAAALHITRQSGFETVNARSIAGRLGCSTRPIFTCYDSMDQMKREFLDIAFDFYDQYVKLYAKEAHFPIYLQLPLSYIAFAREESHVFRLLFVSDMDLEMGKADDFYRESGNVEKARAFADAIGMDPEPARTIFLDLFFYAHGMAVLASSGKLSLDEWDARSMVCRTLQAMICQKLPDWELPCGEVWSQNEGEVPNEHTHVY